MSIVNFGTDEFYDERDYLGFFDEETEDYFDYFGVMDCE